jgi:hypothetical protein
VDAELEDVRLFVNEDIVLDVVLERGCVDDNLLDDPVLVKVDDAMVPLVDVNETDWEVDTEYPASVVELNGWIRLVVVDAISEVELELLNPLDLGDEESGVEKADALGLWRVVVESDGENTGDDNDDEVLDNEVDDDEDDIVATMTDLELELELREAEDCLGWDVDVNVDIDEVGEKLVWGIKDGFTVPVCCTLLLHTSAAIAPTSTLVQL